MSARLRWIPGCAHNERWVKGFYTHSPLPIPIARLFARRGVTPQIRQTIGEQPKPGDLGSRGFRCLPCFLQRGHEVFLHVFGSRADNGNCFFQLLIRYPEPPGPITTLPSPIQVHPVRVGRIVLREIVSHNASLGKLSLSAHAELLTTNLHSCLSITTLLYPVLCTCSFRSCPSLKASSGFLWRASPIKYPDCRRSHRGPVHIPTGSNAASAHPIEIRCREVSVTLPADTESVVVDQPVAAVDQRGGCAAETPQAECGTERGSEWVIRDARNVFHCCLPWHCSDLVNFPDTSCACLNELPLR